MQNNLSFSVILHNSSLAFPVSVIDFADIIHYNKIIPQIHKEAVPCKINIRCSEI